MQSNLPERVIEMPLDFHITSPIEGATSKEISLVPLSNSQFTWIPASLAKALNLPLSRKRKLVCPFSHTIVTVDTVIAKLTCQSLQGVDEVVVSQNAGRTCLGRRTLLSLQARIVSKGLSLLLLPHRSFTEYDTLRKRLSRLLPHSIPKDPLEHDDYSLATLCVAVFMRRISRHRRLSAVLIAEELRILLDRVIKCPWIDIWTCTSISRNWNRKWKSVSNGIDIPTLHKLVEQPDGADEQLMGWCFPSKEVSHLLEPMIMCAIGPASPEQAYFVRRLYMLLVPIVDSLFLAHSTIDSLEKSRESAKELLRLDRNREAVMTYNLLDEAKRVYAQWSNLSFWRTSRTSNTLERTAEYNFETRTVRLDSIHGWSTTTTSDEPRGRDLHQISGIAFPISLHSQQGAPLAQGTSDVETPASHFLVTTKSHKQYRVSFNRTARDNTTAILQNLGLLLDALNTTDDHFVSFYWSRLGDAAGEFHMLSTITSDMSNLSSLCLPAQQSLCLSLTLRIQQFNVLSSYRRHVRLIGDFITSLHLASDLVALGDRLAECISHLLHTSTFAVVNRDSGELVVVPATLLKDATSASATATIPEVPMGDVLFCQDISDIGPASIALSRHAQKQFSENRTYNRILTALPQTDSPGGLMTSALIAPITPTHMLAIFKATSIDTPWKPSSTDVSYSRTIAAAIQLTPPLRDREKATIREKTSEVLSLPVDILYPLLTRSDDSAMQGVRAMLQELEEMVSLPDGSTPSATLFAVDLQELFVKVLVGKKEGVVHSNSVSMLTYTLDCHRSGRKEPHPLVGLISSSGDSVTLLDIDMRQTGPALPFLGLIDASPNDVVITCSFLRIDSHPMGFVVVNLGNLPQTAAECDVVRGAIQLVETYCERIGMVLQRQIQIRENAVRQALTEPFRKLHAEEPALVTQVSDVNHAKEMPTKHLPSALRRVFTSRYCASIASILRRARELSKVVSISCRIKYPGADNQDGLWLLAKSGENRTYPESCIYDPLVNAQSWVCSRHIGGSGNAKVFLPDVTQTGFLDDMYPGIHYERHSLETSSVLCHAVKVPGEEDIWVCISVESSEFTRLWMLEEYFGSFSERLASEVILHLRRTEASVREGVHLGVLFVGSLEHELRKLGYLPGKMRTEPEKDVPQYLDRIWLETDIAVSLMSDSAAKSFGDTLEVHDIVDWAIRYTSPRCPHATIISIGGNVGCRIPSSAKLLLAKTILEQHDTLNRIGDSSHVHIAVGWRGTENGGMSIDIFNSCRPSRETLKLADKLFWFQIDIDREAAGRTGVGLYLIGQMLRMIGCRPNVHRQPTFELQSAYGAAVASKLATTMLGMCIELHFPRPPLGVTRM